LAIASLYRVQLGMGLADKYRGKARARQMDYIRLPIPKPPAGPEKTYLAGPSTPRINVLPSALHIDELGRSPAPLIENSIEEPEIEALLLAQRARTPIALAVAQDYLEPPFKVPRAFVVLGWFWLTDAWVSFRSSLIGPS
jgi:hypothetical protein